MFLISNHLLSLQEFKDVKDVVIRINMAHVKDKSQLDTFLSTKHDIFLDYPKGRSKPPTPTLHISDALEAMAKYKNIKYFAVSNIETSSEVPKHVSFCPKSETVKGVIGLEEIFKTGYVRHIMLDAEDLYTDVQNDVNLFLQLKERVKKTCADYNVKCLELYGVIFKG